MKASEPVLIVAMPFLTLVTRPIRAPVLSFTDMPVATSAPAPALAAERGVWVMGGAALGAALERPEVVGGMACGAVLAAGC